ncbi:cytochrome P450 6j1 [Anabrus simplex]|uniref:cytochrome P450 6j1 n=1 Tax=Anabrus simplex TaxID=316456 RepID=UPI0035A34E10
MALIMNSLLMDVAVFLLAMYAAIYVYLVRNFNVWMKKGVPFLKPIAGFGNFKSVMVGNDSIGSFLKNVYNEAKNKPYVGVFILDQPVLVIRDVDLIKAILVKDFHYFADRDFKPDIRTDSLSARSLVGLTGPKWRYMRTTMTPTFTSGKMKKMFHLVNECGQELVTYLDSHRVDGCLGVKDAMARFTTDVIASCAFGMQGKALKEDDSDLRRMLRKIFEFSFSKSLKMAASKFAPYLLSLFNLQIIDNDVTDYVRNVVWQSIEYREKNGVTRNDFLDLLIQIKNKGAVDDEDQTEKSEKKSPPMELEDDDFVAQAFTFLTAGFETSSTTLSFALYELSLQPDIQKRLRDDIQSALAEGDGTVSYEALQRMVYLDQVLSETLRKYPVLPFLDRRSLKPYRLPGDENIILEKDQTIIIPVLGLHWDPEFFPKPEQFNPEHFSEENKRIRPHYSYLPFGEGPRNCIGMRMGLMQAKVGLVHILTHFEVSPCENTPIPLELDPKSFLLSAKGDLPLNFQPLR